MLDVRRSFGAVGAGMVQRNFTLQGEIMLSFFKKNQVPIAHTDEGSHGRHWYTMFGKADTTVLMQKINDAMQSGEQKTIDKNTFFVDGANIRTVVQNGIGITGFPYWKGSRYENVETALITEWSHADNLEAIVQAGHSTGCRLDFFAIDYAFHKEQYTNQKNISVNVVGLIYVLEDFDAAAINQERAAQNPRTESSLKFSGDFSGYFPGDFPDEISFIGNIKAIQEHALGNVEGFIITITLTSDFSIDAFIAKTNLKIDLILNKQVTGLLWLIGTLEK